MDFKKISFKKTIGMGAIIALLLMFWLMRGCSQEDVQRKRLYLIGRDNTWHPYNLMGKEKNLIAFTNDLFSLIAQETQLRFVFIDTSPFTILEGLNNEQYDAIISLMRPNFVNRNQYLFSELFFELGPVLIVHQNSTATSLKDMQGKTVGIAQGSYFIFNNLKEVGAHAYNIHLVSYDNMNRALNQLEANRLDGLIMNTIPAYTLKEGFHSGSLKIVTAPLTDEGLRLITLHNKMSEEFLKDFDDALTTLKENGTYAQLITKWNLIDPSVLTNPSK